MVSLFPKITATTGGQHLELAQVLAGIASGQWREAVEAVRQHEAGSDAYDAAKRALPYFTPSGTFERRAVGGLVEHSGFMSLDLDAKPNPDTDWTRVRTAIEADEHTYAVFTSTGGVGLCVIVPVPTTHHLASFRALEAYYAERFSVRIDQSCKDVSRARFVSYDPALRINEGAETFAELVEDTKPKTTPPRAQPVEPAAPVRDFEADKIAVAVGMIRDAVDGGKHKKVADAGYLLGGYIASGFVDEQRAFDALMSAVLAKENVTSVKNAEEAIRSGFRKGAEFPLLPTSTRLYVRERRAEGMGADAITAGLAAREGISSTLLAPAVSNIFLNVTPELLTFWKKKPTPKRDGYKLDLDRDKLLAWLHAEGFRAMPDGKDVLLLRVLDNIVFPMERPAIKHHVRAFVRTLPDEFDEDLTPDRIMDLLLTQLRGAFDQELLHLLEPLTGEFVRDRATSCYTFFENCWVETTAAGRTPRPYAELPGLIHASQRRTHPFVWLNDDAAKQCDFFTFTQRVTGDSAEPLSQLQRALGYLSHSYKDITNARCVIFMDKIGEVGKSSGGTGKGLLMQAVAQLVEVAELKGETFDLRDAFRYEEVSDTAKVVFFDEWRPQRNPLTVLFSEITGGLPINRKYQAKKTIPFKDSPKFSIATNDVVTGDDDSTLRRRVDIALTKRYSAEFTPKDEFGTGFFGEYWDSAEYNRFFNLALMWVQDYLANGLLLLHDESIAARGLVQDVGVTFHEFATDLWQLAQAQAAEGKDAPLWLDEVLEAYQKQTADKRLTAITLGKKMTQYGFVKVRNAARRYGDDKRFKTYFALPGQEEKLTLEL